MPEISREEVAHLATLARIDLSDDELDHLAPQLSVILESVASINGVAAADRIDRGDLGRILRLTPPAPVRALRSAVHWFNLGDRTRARHFPARKAVAHRRPIPRAPESLL